MSDREFQSWSSRWPNRSKHPSDEPGRRVAKKPLHPHIIAMQDTERSSESTLERKERLEAAITEALQREAIRHEAALKNMQRLRALRRDQKAKRK